MSYRLIVIDYLVFELQNTERMGQPRSPDRDDDDSVASGDGIALISQVLRQILFHLHRRLIGHRVEVLVQFRQQSVTIPFHDPGRFITVLMVQKSLING